MMLSNGPVTHSIRTLVTDAWQGTLPGNWPELFEQWLIDGMAQNQSLNANPVQQKRDIGAQNTSTECGPSSFNVEQLIIACCLKRRFFVTEHGRFGLGPTDTCKADLVCVLLGSHVPFILSKLWWKLGLHFKGQAFVDGIMD